MSPAPTIDQNLRKSIFLLAPSSEFEHVLFDVLPQNIPTSYVENFAEMRMRSCSAFPRSPRIIFTAYAYDANEPFKFWAAEQTERGAILVGTQHGCHYGTARMFQEEDHQFDIYDTFYTWGWNDSQRPARPLAAAKFNKVLETVTPHAEGRVLFVGYVFPRYAYKLFSVPVGAADTIKLLQEQYRFALALPVDLRSQLLVRLFPNDRDWGQRNRWEKAVDGIECYSGRLSMREQMKQSRIMITLGGSTPHLEALVANYPVIVFANPDLFEIRDSARPHYDALRKAEMLFETPEAAALKLVALGTDIDKWWNSTLVQTARVAFCNQYARTSRRWMTEWRTEFRRLAAATHDTQPSA